MTDGARLAPAIDDGADATLDRAIVRRLGPFVRPHRGLLVATIVAIAAFVTTQLAFPYLIRRGIDAITGVSEASAMPVILGGFAAAIVANAAASYAADVFAARLAQRVIFALRRAMFAHLQQLPMAVIDSTHVGRVMSRLQGDVNALQDFFETSIIAVGDLALLIGIVAVLFAMEWRLALLTLLLLPALWLLRALWLPRSRRTFARARDASSVVNAALAENIAGIRVVLGARREPLNLARFTALAERNRDAQLAASWSAQIMTPAVDSLTGVAMAVVVAGGGWLAVQGWIDLGVLVAFIFYVQRFFDPVRTVAQQYTMLQRATAAAHRIFEVLDVPVVLTERDDALDPERLAPTIEFDDVTFGYRAGAPVIHGLSLTIAARETVALVGPTGSGKSSIAALVRRFYDVDTGAVRVGGVDVRDLSFAALARTVTMVLQEPFLFTGTVLDNIRYASEATRDRVIEAARAVGADPFIRRLPLGYDTPLDQRGQNLSLGQRQLLSIARALVANPAILILDEATASIDSTAEAEIQRAMRALLAGRTSLVIAHRLATVRDADRIIVLRDGRILEQGTPSALLASGGLYATLHRHNQASFEAAVDDGRAA